METETVMPSNKVMYNMGSFLKDLRYPEIEEKITFKILAKQSNINKSIVNNLSENSNSKNCNNNNKRIKAIDDNKEAVNELFMDW